jgi:hypothetical protein
MHSDVISVLAAMLREARYKRSLKVSLFYFDKHVLCWLSKILKLSKIAR